MREKERKKEFNVRISVVHKIMLYAVFLVYATVGISAYTAVKIETNVLTSEATRFGKSVARGIAFGAEKAFVSLNWIFVEKMLVESVQREPGKVIYTKIVKANGEIYMANERACYGEVVEPGLLVDQETVFDNYAFVEGDGMLVVRPATIGGERWYVMVGLSSGPIRAAIKGLIVRNVVSGSVIVLLGIGVSFLLAKSICKPIIGLTKAAKMISDGDLDHRVTVNTKDEVGLLAETFNLMTNKLKESYTHLEEKVKELTVELLLVNERLEYEVGQHTSVQNILEKRIKELNCLFGLSRLVERPEIPLGAIFQETTELICMAYQYPDVTCVRITFNGVKYQTDNFDKSELSQHAQINVAGEKAGDIEVYYLGEKSGSDEDIFLQEERELINTIAEHLGRIAERKKTGEELQLFRNLIDQSNDSIFVIDPEWGRFLDINDRTCDCLGYTREELLQMSVKDIDETIPDDSAWTQRAKEIRQEGYMVLESRQKRKDGMTFPIEVNVKLISQERRDYIVAVARDITERKRAEDKQAELLQQVESANRELTDFAYVVSHDLKAPLRGIKTLADWMVTDYADKLDEDGREQVNLLSSRVSRMHNLIDGVLQYSRVGRVKEKHIKINLNELVSEIIDMIMPPENIEITVEDKLPVVELEETRILQVFQNLLSNAVKYMDKPQGRITIGCVQENGFWKFSVTDNGPGIEEKYFEKIFQIFQTLSPRDEVESTGVGLSVVKKIVEMYGGKIWVESKPGEGSTFFFTLPKPESEVIDDAELEANIVS